MVSTDGGHSWQFVLTGGPVISLQFSTTDPTRLFSAVSSPKSPALGFAPGIYTAQGNGLVAGAWRQLHGCPGAPLPTLPNPAEVWVAESQGQLWMSSKSGTNVQLWRSLNKPCMVIAGQEDSWEQLPLAPVVFGKPCSDSTHQWSYLFAHPSNPATLFKAGIDLCRSADGGASFNAVGTLYGDQHAIRAATGNPNIIYAGNDGGIYRSDDQGATWRFIGDGLAVTEFYDVDGSGVAPRLFVGGTQDNEFATYDGASPVWTRVDCPGPANCGDTGLVSFGRLDKSMLFEMGQSTEQLNSYKDAGSEQAIGDDSHKCLISSENPTVLRSLVSTGTLPPAVVTCQGLWLGPPWTQIQPAGATGDFVRAQLTKDNVWLAGTDQGIVMGGTTLTGLAQIFAARVSKPTSALAAANDHTFYVGVTDRSGPNESGNRLFRLDCKTGPLLTCGNEEIGDFLPAGEIMAIAADPLHADTILVALRGKGIFRGARLNLVIEPLMSAANVSFPVSRPSASPATLTPVSPAGPTEPRPAATRFGAGHPAHVAAPAATHILAPHLVDIFHTYRWSPYDNGLPFGVTATDIDVNSNGRFLLATFGRGAFVLSSREAPANTNGSVTGHVITFEEERLHDGPAGGTNPLITTVEIDARPGWVFSGTNVGAAAYVLKTAYNDHRYVTLTYKITGTNHGTIISAH